jgi:hypothetical protein
MDISLLRKAPADRIRTVNLFGTPAETAEVLFCGAEEMKQIRTIAAELTGSGTPADDAYNLAFGRVALRGWSGLTDNDKPLPFSQENVDLLMLGSAEIRSVVLQAASSLRGGVEKN